ncbi:MAG: pseudaminic acid synthase [Alphaproteobacteria bacterium]
MTDTTFAIAGRAIGPEHPPYIVAELSGNHFGSKAHMLRLLEAASRTGADAVKLQTYTPDTITLDHDGPEFRLTDGPWAGRTLYDLYTEAHTPWDWHADLFSRGRELGITVFSSPFDETAIALLESLGAPAYKIASFECIDLPLIAAAAATGKPLIISTGMADDGEIAEAVAAARAAHATGVALLHCVSAYPARAEDYHLRSIPALARSHGVVAGLSDHTLGTTVAVAAVSLGACIVEKHMTMARADGGPDASFSLEPDEFATLVRTCREAWAALGSGAPAVVPEEERNARLRRSLYAVADIPGGAPLTRDNVRSIRPGNGLAPKHLPSVLGRRARTAIARGTPLAWTLID